ncbi:hypothetical protein [Hymenobacter actinosclerus]|uniref:hypothetical protein n=1 Tax=Hymenobacter actinosclerus TaxID=82805 RepID=UPI0015A5FDF5|nr:hypothetical protein [Hymenobacter actinosclerus]
MKKLLIFGVFLSFTAASCSSSCPAYSSAKPAQHRAAQVEAPVVASTAQPTDQQ